MNAKKIMGAVLVALLAVTAFAGVAAATDYGTVFTYQDLAKAPANAADVPEGVWTNGAAQVTVSGKIVYPGANFVAGVYKFGDHKLYVTYPTASYAVKGQIGTEAYLVGNGGNVYENTTLVSTLTPTITSSSKVDIINYLLTLPSGKVEKVPYANLTGTNLTDEKGTYKVQAIFNESKFVEGVPDNLLLDTVNALTFTVVGEDDATISASVNTVYAGETLSVTVKGTPGTVYAFKLENFNTPVLNQYVTLQPMSGFYNFTMPNNGEATFQFTVAGTANDDATIKLYTKADLENEIETIEITVSAAVITATLGADSYFVGDVIKISGTSTAGIDKTYDFNITGTNFKETKISNDASFKKEGKTWEVELATDGVTSAEGKGLDVGTYTISIEKDGVTVKTLAVALKQPFISILEAPEVVVQGTDAEFIVNAEATKAQVKAYVFGTNYFLEVDHIKKTEKDVDNKFTLTINKTQTSAKNMSAGQYFMVIQHPMYDGAYNIMVDGTIFYLNTAGNAVVSGNPGTSTELFNVNDRQTANAAQALCDALDTQNIDDMYVKYSFFVVGEDESFTMSEIPTEVVKGDKIVISGVSTANEGATVTVEMISTAFAAVPKETVGSAAFIVATAKIADDGTWEVTLDTSDLNVDEYSLSVAVSNSDKPWKNTKINVVEGAETPDTPDTPDVPDTPDTPDTPTEPTTPGFGALAALAGLGAVAVLLLRRE